MKTTIDFEDEKSLLEANNFLKKLKDKKINKKYELIFNKQNIYKKKILSASFIIKFENDFYLKVLKEYGVYGFEFISAYFQNGKTNFGESREYNINLFAILCDIRDDIYFDVNSYFPENFETTESYKKYYEYNDDGKGKRHYGIKVDQAIELIAINYDLINDKLKEQVSFLNE